MTTNQTNAEAQRAAFRLLDVERGLANLARQLANLDERLADLESQVSRMAHQPTNPTDTKE